MKEIVSRYRWQSVKKIVNGKELSASEGIKHTGIVDELLELYANDSHDIATPFAESRMAKKTLCSCVPSAY